MSADNPDAPDHHGWTPIQRAKGGNKLQNCWNIIFLDKQFNAIIQNIQIVQNTLWSKWIETIKCINIIVQIYFFENIKSKK